MNDALTDTYLRELDAALAGVPDAARQSILDDVRAHVADAAAEGRDVPATLAALGAPEEVARDAREQLGVPAASAPDPAERAGRLLHWAALALAVVTAVFVTFVMPMYTTGVEVAGTEGTEEAIYRTATLFEEMGIGIGLLPLLPASLVLLPLVLPARLRGIAGWTVAALVTAASIVAGFTIGGFYVPLALLLGGAMLVPVWIRRGRRRVSGWIWRIVGALALALPAVFTFSGLFTGTLQDASTPLWITLFVVILVAVLFALGLPFIDLIVAVVGVALMLLGVFDAGMLLMAFWWAGGLWLAAGLCGLAARGRIR